MFEELSSKFERTFKFVLGKGKLTESDIDEFLRELRRVLLEADVNYKVAKVFAQDIKKQVLGSGIYDSINPGHLIMNSVNSQLSVLMGEKRTEIKFAATVPSVIMLVGLQGSGKTTFAAKLARYLKLRGRAPVLAACDIRRPAAAEQLKTLGKQAEVPVIAANSEQQTALNVLAEASDYCRRNIKDVLIADTAGRLSLDDEMMKEAEELKESIRPSLFILLKLTSLFLCSLLRQVYNNKLLTDNSYHPIQPHTYRA